MLTPEFSGIKKNAEVYYTNIRNVIYIATSTPIVSVCCKSKKIKNTFFFSEQESPAQLDTTTITS